MNGVEKRRKPFLDMTEVVLFDMAKITMLSVVCNAVSDDTSFQKQLKIEKVGKMVNGISSKILRWSLNELALAWPNVIKKYATMEIESQSEIAVENFNKTAKKIKRIVNNRGSANFLHQVSLFELWKANDYYVSDCEEEVCIEIEANQVRVVITRYNLKEENEIDQKFIYDRKDDAFKWFKSNHFDLKNTLKFNSSQSKLKAEEVYFQIVDKAKMRTTSRSSVENGKDLQSIRKDLIKNVGLANPAMFRTVLLIRNSKWLNSSCTIQSGIAYTKIENQIAFDKVDYLKYSFWFNVNYYLILFFI
uniref:Uncharacterized protein n=2 Tax=Meloidogyne hapla TaxID=6305 RepID=A0A1I8BYR4_MELHA